MLNQHSSRIAVVVYLLVRSFAMERDRGKARELCACGVASRVYTVREPISKRAHTQLVREHSATVVSAR